MPAANASAARWPPRVPVCQIAHRRSIHLSPALNATAIASTSSTPANTCGLSRIGAVARNEIADAGGGNQHFRDDDADDHERAADAQARQYRWNGRREDDTDQALGKRRAHAAGGEQELRIDGPDAGGGRQHRRQEAIDRRERDLGFRADAKPHREHRIEDDQRHCIEAGDHRHDQEPRARQAADQRTQHDAAATGKDHRNSDLIQRHHQRAAIFASLVPARGQGRGQRRQEQFGHEVSARQELP